MSTKFAEVAPRAGRGRGRGRGRRNHQEQQQKLFQEKVVASIPASAVFTQLQEFERRVDATLARKKAEVNEALKSAPPTFDPLLLREAPWFDMGRLRQHVTGGGGCAIS